MIRLTPARRLALLASLCGAAFLSGCTKEGDGPQGWSEKDRADWYDISQGSRMMPYAWWSALEQPDGTAAFGDPAYIESFGYLPPRAGAKYPVPTGFALDRQADADFKVTGLRWYAGQKGDKDNAEIWIGMNCAACHTAEVSYKGQAIRVDGGPSLGDYQAFVEAMDKAVAQTLADGARFGRFAAKVLAGKDTPDNRALLKTALASFDAWEKKVDRQNETPLRYGFARVDAFGHIFNKVALYNQADPQMTNASDAPVSYPFLWNISKQVRVQWNGVVKNEPLKGPGGEFDYGALGRNAGEVIGVFGEVLTHPREANAGLLPKGYKSSVMTENLIWIENHLTKLKAPAWPAAFPAINETLRKRGDELFDQKCASCHLPKDKWETEGKRTKTQGIERMSYLRDMGADMTDPWMACNAATYEAKTGVLQGTPRGFLGKKELLGDTAPLAAQLGTTVIGSLVDQKGRIIEGAVETWLGLDARAKTRIPGDFTTMVVRAKRDSRLAFCTGGAPTKPDELARWNAVKDLLGYKARPLDGIWATAPYLHNGSVPTLYHLLLPPAERPKRFWLGSRDYDAEMLGYVWESKPASGRAWEFVAVGADGKAVDGNGNQGHDYGVSGLSVDDRKALLEYLKSL
ncbi:MAG: hypothetical protein IPN84_15750 [Sphingomonadales bacterium]|nr:hypothetical protein [Sphingomonadales bacterium]